MLREILQAVTSQHSLRRKNDSAEKLYLILKILFYIA